MICITFKNLISRTAAFLVLFGVVHTFDVTEWTSVHKLWTSYVNIPTQNTLRCWNLCERQGKCVAVTFDIQERICYLHDRNIADIETLIDATLKRRFLFKSHRRNKLTDRSLTTCDNETQIAVPSSQNESDTCFTIKERPGDCGDILTDGGTVSDVYTIYMTGTLKPQRVYCDQDTDGGGWLVFQRRKDGSEDFYRGWDDYEQGFGDISGEFWTGNQFLANLTSRRNYTLRVDLENFENETRFAQYSSFVIGADSTNYTLHFGVYSGTAGNSLKNHNGQPFSTNDRDNDNKDRLNCAVTFRGAWWYRHCHTSNLNGLYNRGTHITFADGVNWKDWMGYYYSLRKTEMKLRSTTPH